MKLINQFLKKLEKIIDYNIYSFPNVHSTKNDSSNGYDGFHSGENHANVAVYFYNFYFYLLPYL